VGPRAKVFNQATGQVMRTSNTDGAARVRLLRGYTTRLRYLLAAIVIALVRSSEFR
jgi:hypothetical protein